MTDQPQPLDLDAIEARAARSVGRLRDEPMAMVDEVRRLTAELAEEKHVSQERGRYLAEVDAALTAAGDDEGGGYIAYGRRVAQLADEVRRLTAELQQARSSAFREAARLLEPTGRDDDAVNLLDNVADGITTHTLDPAASSGA